MNEQPQLYERVEVCYCEPARNTHWGPTMKDCRQKGWVYRPYVPPEHEHLWAWLVEDRINSPVFTIPRFCAVLGCTAKGGE